MQPQHPDDRFPLTEHERDQFRRICQELTGDDPERSPVSAGAPARSHPGWSATVIACTVLVFLGLAMNSVLIVLLAAAGGLGAHLGSRRPR